MKLGIDFGTTRTVVAVCDRGNYPVLRFTAGENDSLDGIPTIVAARGGELRYGLDALAVVDDPAWKTLRSFKRQLAEAGGLERMLELDGARVSVFDLVVGFLGHVREAILTRSNLPRAQRKPDAMQAVVATPANALGAQRFLTLEAFRRAGFDVISTLNEPSAAGFEYTHAHRATVTSRREVVVVYDLGGGTFDASLVRVTDLKHDAVLTSGVARLGGDDFDEVLLALVKDKLGETASASESDRLLVACRDAKERLNANSRKVVVEFGDREVSVPVADYYAACAPLVEQTILAMLPIMARTEKQEKDGTSRASLGRGQEQDDAALLSDVAGIYVVGGASALPVVTRVLREKFGRRVFRSPQPSAATAVGLAIAADEESGFELGDRFSRTFGVFREAGAGSDVAFDVVFDRETPIPLRGAPPVRVERQYRVAHDLGHFRFIECSGAARGGSPEGDLSLFGDVRFPFVPELQRDGTDLAQAEVHRLAGLGTRIRETYELDAHGLVHLSIVDEGTGFSRSFALAR